MLKDRASIRHRTFKGGSISFNLASGVDCTIRNMSETGACLDLTASIPVPDEFTLIIKPECLKRTCRVAWRAGSRIGVRFQ